MKKLIYSLLIVLSMLALASCSLGNILPEGGIFNGLGEADDITPILRVDNNNNWYVSHDNGETWTFLSTKVSDADSSPYMQDGYWWIGETNTGVKAEVSNGESTPEFDFYLKDDGTYAVDIGSAMFLSKIVIPSTYRGKAVTEIAPFFRHLTEQEAYVARVKEIYIPNTVTVIGDYAFFGCESLESVVIPDSVTSIGEYVFDRCSNVVVVKYRGTEEEWNKIDKSPYLKNYCTTIYNYNGK